MNGKGLLSGNIHLVDTRNLARLLMEQPECDIFVKFLDVFVPLVAIESLAHDFSLPGVERSVARQHEVQTALTKKESRRLSPCDAEVLWVFEDLLGRFVGSQVDPERDECRTVPRVVRFPSKVLHDYLIFAGNCHGIVGVNGVRFEVVGERSQCQLIEYAALVYAEVMVAFAVSPVGQIFGVLIRLKPHR